MENISESDIKKHKNILKECFFLPFKISKIPTLEENIPIMYSLLDCKIDEENSDKIKYKILLKYGKVQWSVSRHIIDLGRFLNVLRKKNFSFIKMAGVKNIIGHGYFQRLNKLFNECRIELISKIFLDINRIFSICTYTFMGERIYEEMFSVNISSIDDSNRYLYFFKKANANLKMYVVLKRECIIFIKNIEEQEILYVLMFDGNTKIDLKNKIIGKEIYITNLKKKIRIYSRHSRRINTFYESLIKTLENSNHKNKNRYESFAPIRKDVNVEHLIDGKNYFHSLYRAIKSAERTIYIAGWWVFPKLYLKRILTNEKLDKKYRLDSVLKSKAKEGVKIYILLYREYELALPNNSAYSERIFLSLHRNIQVIRHPSFINEGLIFWSHHEKLVVIDSKISFLGGIDLCLGRYDTQRHHLFEEKKIKSEHEAFEKQIEGKIRDKKALLDHQEESEIWPGNDFSNPLIKDFENIGICDKSSIDRNSVPRLPWHDIQCKIYGEGALDVARHFIERWNYTKYESKDTINDFLIPIDENKPKSLNESGNKADIQLLRSIGHWSNKYVTEKSICNAYADIITNAKEYVYIENQFFVTKFEDNLENPLNDLGKSLFNRIVKAHINKEIFKVYIIIPLLPAFEAELNSPHSNIQEIIKIQSDTFIKSNNSFFKKLNALGIDAQDYVLLLSLRRGNLSGSRNLSELIYVHSKIIIADASRCIIGSANFNDRSMLGDRDSEVAVLVENGKYFIQDFQKNLLVEHLGINSKKGMVNNMLSDEGKLNEFFENLFKNAKDIKLGENEIFNAIKLRAKINTGLFKQLYRVIPDNDIRSKLDFQNFCKLPSLVLSMADKNELKKIFSRIKGHLVLYPYEFFVDENPQTGLFSVSGYIPLIIYY